MKAAKEIGADLPVDPPVVEAPAVMAVETPPPAPVEIPLSLDDFCQNFSKAERRVVLLGAFHFEMKRQKRLKDTESNYRAAFAVFVTAPA